MSKIVTRLLAGAALVAALALAIAACSSSPSTTTQPALGGPAATTPKPANPVPILRKTGVPVPASEINGTVGCCGDRVANGTFPGGEDIWVFTYDTAADMQAAIKEHIPSDGETGIQGPGLTLITVDASDNGGYEVPPSVIARRVGGKDTGPGT